MFHSVPYENLEKKQNLLTDPEFITNKFPNFPRAHYAHAHSQPQLVCSYI